MEWLKKTLMFIFAVQLPALTTICLDNLEAWNHFLIAGDDDTPSISDFFLRLSTDFRDVRRQWKTQYTQIMLLLYLMCFGALSASVTLILIYMSSLKGSASILC